MSTVEEEELRDESLGGVLSKALRVWKNACELLQDRGYEAQYQELTPATTFEEFLGLVRGREAEEIERKMEVKAVHAKKKENASLWFHVRAKLGVGHLRQVESKMKEEGFDRLILVYRDGCTPSVKRSVAEPKADLAIELFSFLQLSINVTKHELVPKHEAVPPGEVRQILSKYDASAAQMPRMKESDPVCRWLGLKAGTLVRITRDSPIVGSYVTYRMVVKD